MKKILYLLLITFFAGITQVSAQNGENYGSGLKVALNPEGNKYVRFIIWNQIWARQIQNNPGTLINGTPRDNTWDIGARRLRFLAFAQVSPRYLIVTHFGINNQIFANGGASGTAGTGAYGQGKKPQLFFHDAYNEYAIRPALNPATGIANKFTLFMGAGLHYWNGISRLSSASTLNFLMIDAPVFNWPLIELSDQFAREFGVYVKGIARKFHYQVSVNKPFATNLIPVDNANVAVDNNGDPAAAWSGYFDYQFLDQESNVLPYRVGTYLGDKKVFNVGAGFYANANGTKSSPAPGVIKQNDIKIFSGDVFLDLPIGNKEKDMAVTFYGVYYNYNFGPNYIRYSGTMNPGTTNATIPAADRVLEGAGNSRVLLGTGSIVYGQAGFFLPDFSKKVRVQPIASLAYKKFDALNAAGNFWDAGANFYIDAHNAKITAQYSSRPLYDAVTKVIKDRKGEFLLQLQIYL